MCRESWRNIKLYPFLTQLQLWKAGKQEKQENRESLFSFHHMIAKIFLNFPHRKIDFLLCFSFVTNSLQDGKKYGVLFFASIASIPLSPSSGGRRERKKENPGAPLRTLKAIFIVSLIYFFPDPILSNSLSLESVFTLLLPFSSFFLLHIVFSFLMFYFISSLSLGPKSEKKS